MIEQTTHKVINGDCRNMSNVSDNFVELIIDLSTN
jgi:hypothetical protein